MHQGGDNEHTNRPRQDTCPFFGPTLAGANLDIEFVMDACWVIARRVLAGYSRWLKRRRRQVHDARVVWNGLTRTRPGTPGTLA
jgi:hypothetical protein